MTHEEKWRGVWYGFVVDLLNESGYLEIRAQDPKDVSRVEALIAFFDKLDKLSMAIPLMLGFSRILSSGTKPDPDDIQRIGRILQEFGPSPAVEQLKSNIREFQYKGFSDKI